MFRRMKEDVLRAMSEPDERAMETSEAVRAGVSFVPSPMKAIILRLFLVLEDSGDGEDEGF